MNLPSAFTTDIAAAPTFLGLERFGATFRDFPNIKSYAKKMEVGIPMSLSEELIICFSIKQSSGASIEFLT
jgi:hypothetical protein